MMTKKPKNEWPMSLFFERYDHMIIPEPNSGCWIWLGSMTGSGYGKINRAGIMLAAHRCAFEAVSGTPGAMVRHRCDVKLCVNPAHLLSGTAADNTADAVGRDLVPHGPQHWRSKLTPESVALIRSNPDRLPQRELARRHGVSQSRVSDIQNGRSWRRQGENR